MKKDTKSTRPPSTQSRLDALQNSQTDSVDPDYVPTADSDHPKANFKPVPFGPKQTYTSQVTPGDWQVSNNASTKQ